MPIFLPMEKIVVATDLSSASRAGIRYAIQRSLLTEVNLEFVYVFHTWRATTWTDQQYKYYREFEAKVRAKELFHLVRDVYREGGHPLPDPLSYTAYHHPDTVEGIMEFAVHKKAHYLFTSTGGAGGVKRWFGTTATKLIERSSIPVFCAPSSKPVKSMDRVLYASDMSQYLQELKQVAEFARPANAKIDLLHLYYPFEFMKDEDHFREKLEQMVGYPVELFLKARDLEQTILGEIKIAIRRNRPAVLVLFTHQGRSFFDRLLLPANAREYAFQASIPLLSFPKPVKSRNKD